MCQQGNHSDHVLHVCKRHPHAEHVRCGTFIKFAIGAHVLMTIIEFIISLEIDWQFVKSAFTISFKAVTSASSLN